MVFDKYTNPSYAHVFIAWWFKGCYLVCNNQFITLSVSQELTIGFQELRILVVAKAEALE